MSFDNCLRRSVPLSRFKFIEPQIQHREMRSAEIPLTFKTVSCREYFLSRLTRGTEISAAQGKHRFVLTTGRISNVICFGPFSRRIPWCLPLVRDQKPRCVKYDFGEEKTARSRPRYWNVGCRFLDLTVKSLPPSLPN